MSAPATPSPTAAPEYGSLADACLIAAMSRSTAERLIAADRFPTPVRLGRLRRWDLAEFRRWLAAGAPDRATWEASKR